MKRVFPKVAIEERLRAWYKRKSSSSLRRKLTKKSGVGTVFDVQPEISSVESVEVFLEVEPLIEFQLSKKGNLIKAGGYRSADEFVKDLLPRIEATFNQFYKIAKSIPTFQRPVSAINTHVN